MSLSAPQFEYHDQPKRLQSFQLSPSLLENEDEIARWLMQQQFLSRMMGGPLPPIKSLAYVSRVLDVGCGAGAWVQEMARCYPHIHVVGIDKSIYFIVWPLYLMIAVKRLNRNKGQGQKTTTWVYV